MADLDMLTALGLRTQDLAGGFSGGVVNAFIFQRSTPIAAMGSIIVGTLTAAYLSEPAAKYFGTTGGATAFLVGLCAMAICQGIITAIGKWTPTPSGTPNA